MTKTKKTPETPQDRQVLVDDYAMILAEGEDTCGNHGRVRGCLWAIASTSLEPNTNGFHLVDPKTFDDTCVKELVAMGMVKRRFDWYPNKDLEFHEHERLELTERGYRWAAAYAKKLIRRLKQEADRDQYFAELIGERSVEEEREKARKHYEEINARARGGAVAATPSAAVPQ